MNRWTALILTVWVAAALLLVAGPAAATSVDDNPDRTIQWAGSEANHVPYWEDYFTRPNRPDVRCTKVDEGGEYITIGGGHERLVIKNDQRNLIWFNPPAGAYASDKGVSHYFVCDWKKKTTKKVNPSARIIGPAGDPFFRYVLDNRKSERPVTFIISPWGKRVTVPGGCVYRTGWHYERPYVTLSVLRGNGDELARRSSGPGGYYGPLWKGFDKGETC